MLGKTDQGDNKQRGTQKVEDFMKVYSKKDSKKTREMAALPMKHPAALAAEPPLPRHQSYSV